MRVLDFLRGYNRHEVCMNGVYMENKVSVFL